MRTRGAWMPTWSGDPSTHPATCRPTPSALSGRTRPARGGHDSVHRGLVPSARARLLVPWRPALRLLMGVSRFQKRTYSRSWPTPFRRRWSSCCVSPRLFMLAPHCAPAGLAEVLGARVCLAPTPLGLCACGGDCVAGLVAGLAGVAAAMARGHGQNGEWCRSREMLARAAPTARPTRAPARSSALPLASGIGSEDRGHRMTGALPRRSRRSRRTRPPA